MYSGTIDARYRPYFAWALAVGAVLLGRAFSCLARACTLLSRERSSADEACRADDRSPCGRFHLGWSATPFRLASVSCSFPFSFPFPHVSSIVLRFSSRAQDNVPAMVMDGLWIGSIHAAFNQDSMQDRGITHVSEYSSRLLSCLARRPPPR